MPLEPLSLLCTFKNSSKYIITTFDSDSFLEELKGLFKKNFQKLKTIVIWNFLTENEMISRKPKFMDIYNVVSPREGNFYWYMTGVRHSIFLKNPKIY